MFNVKIKKFLAIIAAFSLGFSLYFFGLSPTQEAYALNPVGSLLYFPFGGRIVDKTFCECNISTRYRVFPKTPQIPPIYHFMEVPLISDEYALPEGSKVGNWILGQSMLYFPCVNLHISLTGVSCVTEIGGPIITVWGTSFP